MRKLAALLVLLLLSLSVACVPVMDTVAKGVHRYCDTTEPAEQEVIRARIDPKTAPHTVRIECSDGDA